jgi:type I restriction enzyme R subunit
LRNKATRDLFEKELHAYTITHAIEDRNVLRFHVDYYKPKEGAAPKRGQTFTKQAVAQAILDKHDAATGGRRFNALLATASINDAIEYYDVFKKLQAARQAADPEFVPLKIAAVFSPPAEGNKDVQQIQEDLPQEKEDNRHDPEGKKTALKAIIADYNTRYGTNHDINNFDLYYQDVQQRIKDQQFPNRDLPRKGEEKIDVTIVVDMLLTGFDAKFLNTLYVDKNLKHHGLIQAFSRTNRVLNATKPYGHILDFRDQQDNVDAAIAMFSGAQSDRAREIWLVDKAPVVIDSFKTAVAELGEFMKSHGLEAKPDQVNNLKGDDARAQFIDRFKEVQRLQTQLDQYTDLTDAQRGQIEQTLPKDDLRAFRGVYLETAQRLKEQQGKPGGDGEVANLEVDQLDFEFVLFASAVIDYDYIMKLIAKYSGQDPKKVQISRDQLIGLIQSDAKFLDEREEITEYVRSLTEGEGLDEAAIRAGYDQFKAAKQTKEIEGLAQTHGLSPKALAGFVDTILQRMIFDGEQLTDLMEPLDLGWRERRERELALMADLIPLLNKRAHGRDISGLNAYEQGVAR